MLTFSVNKDINDIILEGKLSVEKPTTAKGREWVSEFVFKSLAGKTKEDGNNLDAYGAGCDRNDTLKKMKRETALLTVDEIQQGLKGVADTVAYAVDYSVDAVLDSSEVKTLLTDFLSRQEDILIDEGINLWKVLKLSREGNTSTLDTLKDLIDTYELSELIGDVLRNEECLGALEEAMSA